MLACSRYFLGCPWPCLTGARKAKVADGDLAMVFIKVIFTWSISIWDVSKGFISVKDTSARDTCIDIGLSDIGSWFLIK